MSWDWKSALVVTTALALFASGCDRSKKTAAVLSAVVSAASVSASARGAALNAPPSPARAEGSASPPPSESGPPPFPLPMPVGSAPNPNHVAFDKDEDLAHHLMTCLSADQPSVCPWWPSAYAQAEVVDLEAKCKAGRQVACLSLGLLAIGKGDQTAAAAKLGPACDAHERLACVYLAYTQAVCADARKKARPLCQWKLELYHSEQEAKDTLEDACARDIGAACLALGDVTFRQYDNRFTYLERACRFGSIQACASLYDDLAGLGVAPRVPMDRIRRLGYRMLTICGYEPADCFIAADQLAAATNIPRSSYLFQACDQDHALHIPAERCR